MYRQCNASMHSEQNQPFLCIGCIASIYFLKILAHSAATVQCITYRWIRGYLGYQRHKWGFQCYQQRCSRWFLAWYQWYRLLHVMFNEKKRSQGALWMVTLYIIILSIRGPQSSAFCGGGDDYIPQPEPQSSGLHMFQLQGLHRLSRLSPPRCTLNWA